MLGDFNIAKFNIPVEILNAFKKGQIDKMYRLMHKEADRISALETKEFRNQKLAEHFGSIGITRGSRGPRGTPLDLTNEIFTYRKERREYHMDRMIEMLKLHAQSE